MSGKILFALTLDQVQYLANFQSGHRLPLSRARHTKFALLAKGLLRQPDQSYELTDAGKTCVRMLEQLKLADG